MIRQYLPEEHQRKQFSELKSEGMAHGKHFSLKPLIEALQEHEVLPLYILNQWNKKGNCGSPQYGTYQSEEDYWHKEIKELKKEESSKSGQNWIKRIRKLQLLLPAHIVNEYCHPSATI